MVENPTSEDSVSHKLTGTVVSILYCCNNSIVLNHIKLVLNHANIVLNHGSKNQITSTGKIQQYKGKDTAFSATNCLGRQLIVALVSIDRLKVTPEKET